jgi:curved DNA-binding protein CbpA
MDALDYYEVLQISPNAEPETIHRVFRILAVRYHPDNPETGDSEKFIRLTKAYDVLGDPNKRADYDLLVKAQTEGPLAAFGSKEFLEGVEAENNRRIGIVCLLYRQRRFYPEEAGLSILQLEALMNIPREHLVFAIWYLKEMMYVTFTDKSDYVITGEGTKFIENNTPKQPSLLKLLSAAQSFGAAVDAAPPNLQARAAKVGR